MKQMIQIEASTVKGIEFIFFLKHLDLNIL